jgi:hypothetical protein
MRRDYASRAVGRERLDGASSLSTRLYKTGEISEDIFHRVFWGANRLPVAGVRVRGVWPE